MASAPANANVAAAPRLEITRPAAGAMKLALSGSWRVGEPVPAAIEIRRELEQETANRIAFDTSALVGWDSALVSFAARVMEIARAADVAVDPSGLPVGAQRLTALAEAVPKRDTGTVEPPPRALARIGVAASKRGQAAKQVLHWIGELTVAFTRLITGRAKFRRRDLFVVLQLTGADALGIVSLVAFLIGLILAFVGAVQLQKFGATIYVADLVGVAVVREIGALMAAIVVAGRTGAAFAAELGTMRVTQEIDALTTLGISPVEFLVLARVLGAALMLPLLCIYADVVGLLGGAVVGVGIMNIPPRVYYAQTIAAVSATDLFGGILKAATYGLLIGAAACFEGLRSGRTAAAVGKAATSAVVDGIVLVITACGVYAVLFYVLGI